MKFFCCTNNLTGCKIIGGVQIAGNAIMLIRTLIAVTEIAAVSQHPYVQKDAAATNLVALGILLIVVFGLAILCAIFLVVAASKRSAQMLMVWIVLNCIGIALLLIGLGANNSKSNSSVLVSIGLSIWALLIAIGARQEVQSGANIA